MDTELMAAQLLEQETKRLALHQSNKTKADLTAYLTGYEFGVMDALEAVEALPHGE
jgi:predicted nucleotidyltransferase